MTVRHVVVQPSIKYYTWQVEVLLINLMQLGINPNHIDIVCSVNEHIDIWKNMASHYNAVRFSFYDDTRESKKYISSIRPHILEKHFRQFPELSQEVIFYHDCDILFTDKIDYSKYVNDDNTWYLSDTVSYIGYDYIISKGQEIFDKMVEIVGIDPQLVIDNQNNSGGAQYILKNIDADFWADVYRDSENLFHEITEINNQIKRENPGYHEIQIWCADMWAVLWNGWKRGIKTVVDKELDFSWGTSPINQWSQYKIYHNAGVTDSEGGTRFYKYEYRDILPYYTNLPLKNDLCSFNYYQYIRYCGRLSVLKWFWN